MQYNKMNHLTDRGKQALLGIRRLQRRDRLMYWFCRAAQLFMLVAVFSFAFLAVASRREVFRFHIVTAFALFAWHQNVERRLERLHERIKGRYHLCQY